MTTTTSDLERKIELLEESLERYNLEEPENIDSDEYSSILRNLVSLRTKRDREVLRFDAWAKRSELS